jgi:Mn-dependent DtxR family transcriptional regulator
MGQEQITKLLKENKGKKLTTKQIAEGIGQTVNSTTSNLKKMRDFNFVKYTKKSVRGAIKAYIYWV